MSKSNKVDNNNNIDTMIKELISLFEGRLRQHFENMKKVLNELDSICTQMLEKVDELKNRLIEEINGHFKEKGESILGLIESLRNKEISDDEKYALMKEGERELFCKYEYKIDRVDQVKNFADSYKFRATVSEGEEEVEEEREENILDDKIGRAIERLKARLDDLDDSKCAIEDTVRGICEKRRLEVEDMNNRFKEKSEGIYAAEDSRLQSTLTLIRSTAKNIPFDDLEEFILDKKAILLTSQKYSLKEIGVNKYDLAVTQEVRLNQIDFEERQPKNLVVLFTDKGLVSPFFKFFSTEEIIFLESLNTPFNVTAKVWEKEKGENTAKAVTKKYIPWGDEELGFSWTFSGNTTYCLKLRIEHRDSFTQWSDVAEFVTPEFKECCVWKECPDSVGDYVKYKIDDTNPRIAAIINDYSCSVPGNTYIPPNTVTSWSIKVLKSKDNNGKGIYIGVAPFDINHNNLANYDYCGWYFNCYSSTLCSGPPHNFRNEKYGPRKGDGEYVHTGDNVGVVMDTTKGALSFTPYGLKLCITLEGIPLDKPLVPCVILHSKDDSIELDTTGVKENVNSSIPVPSNIAAKSITWDSITLAWNEVEGALLYHIKMDENRWWYASTTNTFTKGGLLPATEHSFRVRAVRGSSVSEWSSVVKRRTLEESFETSIWKECPDDVDKDMKYNIDEKDPRIVTNNDIFGCVTIGNTHVPLNTVTQWNIKILKSKDNSGRGIWVGVSPSDINQNDVFNYEKFGWYFYCYCSSLWSGPPHGYYGKEHGPRRENGQYVHTGDNVGVVMDTTRGELSFVVNGVNLGVAYKGIPLDKPLVPCVILSNPGDSVELVV